MDDSNHEMMNMMTHQMATVFNLVIENSTATYHALATQMGRLVDVLGVPDTSADNANKMNNQNSAGSFTMWRTFQNYSSKHHYSWSKPEC
jgi:hypothetical protein